MTTIPFLLVAVMAAMSWRHAHSQSPVRVGRPETPARTAQMSSVAPEHAPEPSSRRLGGVATLAASTHKEKRSAGHPTGQVVTQGDASRVGVADDLAAQLPQTPSVRVTRDTRTEGSNHPLGKAREAADPRSVRLLTESRQGDTETADPRLTVARGRHLNSEPGNDRLGQTSSAVTGEGCALDNLPQAGASGVSGPAVHRGRHVAARAVTDGGPRLGVAS